MNFLQTLWAALWRRDNNETEMAEELRFHIDSRAANLEQNGLSPEQAKRQARVEFGNVEGYKEHCREACGFRPFDELQTDVRYAFRTLRKHPGFTATAILSLALGIGVNLSSFAALSAMVLHPFSYPELNRIMTIAETRVGASSEQDAVAPANYLDWKQYSGSFQYMSAYREWDVNLTGVDRPDHIHAAMASADFFQILNVPPTLGRAFTTAECEPGRDSVVVVSQGFWQTHLAGAKDAVGKTISLGGRKYTVIGVMPDQFNLPLSSALWVPLAFTAEDKEERRARRLSVIGKLAPDVTSTQASVEMDGVAKRLEKLYPQSNESRRVLVTSLQDLMKTESNQFMTVLMCAACFVLLLACTNVSSLQVARAMSKEKEIGLRSSLGASYFRIFRQLLTESLVIGLAGGALGLALAAWDLSLMRSNIPPMVYRIVAGLKDMRINGEVAAYAVALSLVASVLCSIPAMLQIVRSGIGKDVNEVLKEGGRSSSASPARARLRTVLVVAEVALAFILLVGAGLMVGTLDRILSLNLGYNPNNVLTAEVCLSGGAYEKPAPTLSFYDSVLRNLNQTGQFEASAAISSLGSADSLSIEGRPPSGPGELRPEIGAATPQYLKAMRILLLSGRWISDQDGPQTQPVVVVSASVAHQYWPNSNPIGERIKFSPEGRWLRVVGVSGDVKDWFLGNPQARAYIPFQQSPQASAVLLVRGTGDPTRFAGVLRSAAEAVDREQPIYNVRTLERQMHEETSGVRNAVTMMVTYAAIALVLAVSGIYSVSAFFVNQRTREIGVRMSLGATRTAILKMVLRQSCGMTGVGLLIGVPIAIVLTIGMSHALFNVVAIQPATFILILAVLGGAAAVAGYIPARRAAKVDPMIALRHE